MVKNLRKNGIEVIVYKQMSKDMPDSVFPNNWFSTHKHPSLTKSLFFTYPMKAHSRQLEVNPEIVKKVGGSFDKVINIKP
mmetsp:Transcript_15569/g.26293  ORF Transcript_15569/g.26293 Transcript_15569/m.26293 type:complete len:80 (-) Transcript_15569:667-906(-)